MQVSGFRFQVSGFRGQEEACKPEETIHQLRHTLPFALLIDFKIIHVRIIDMCYLVSR